MCMRVHTRGPELYFAIAAPAVVATVVRERKLQSHSFLHSIVQLLVPPSHTPPKNDFDPCSYTKERMREDTEDFVEKMLDSLVMVLI